MPPNAHSLPDHYRCERCGYRYVLELNPKIICNAHNEYDHCHTGEYLLDAHGRSIAVVASPTCLPFATQGAE